MTELSLMPKKPSSRKSSSASTSAKDDNSSGRHFDEIYAQTGPNESSFQCSDSFIADLKRCHGLSSRRFHMLGRNRYCGRIDIERWIGQTTMLLDRGWIGTDEQQRSRMSHRYPRK
jgi:hypothetical protein